ncbi:MAG: hypothetical protein AAF914_03335 [Pseudomonadota bacterium]
MMKLAETAPIAQAALPLAELRTTLRLPEGFSDDGGHDARLQDCARAALALVEARTGKVLLTRSFSWMLERWSTPDRQAFPVAPILGLDALGFRGTDGGLTSLNIAEFRIIDDMHRPALAARNGALPGIPVGATLELSFTAGFSSAWEGVPPDLREAVLILAAEIFDGSPHTAPSIPAAVELLLQRYRSVGLRGIGR